MSVTTIATCADVLVDGRGCCDVQGQCDVFICICLLFLEFGFDSRLHGLRRVGGRLDGRVEEVWMEM